MPILPDGTYPQMVERIGTAEQLMVRPNPMAPADQPVFQRVYVRPARIPKWLRDGLRSAKGKLHPKWGGFHNAASVYRVLKDEARRWAAERFLCLYLDIKNKPVGVVEVSAGTLDASLVHPREVFGGAVATGAASIVCAHNHPSGDPEPSIEDIALTQRLAEAGVMMGMPILDHLVLGSRGFVSLAERGIV